MLLSSHHRVPASAGGAARSVPAVSRARVSHAQLSQPTTPQEHPRHRRSRPVVALAARCSSTAAPRTPPKWPQHRQRCPVAARSSAAAAPVPAPLTEAEKAVPVESTRVAVVGSGPAAHSAAIYLARAELSPLVLEGTFQTASGPGGQLTTTTVVENYPGFPGGIQGYELCERFRAQSKEHGARLVEEKVYRVDFSGAQFGLPLVLWTEETPGVPKRRVEAETVIIATGAAARRLPIPGAGEGEGGYWQRGVSACAVCDGALFRDGRVAVIGGGDTAMEEAMFLSRFVKSVTVVHRFAELEASKVMARRARGNPKISFLLQSEVVRLEGDGESLQRAIIKDGAAGGKTHELAIDALFFGVGHSPCVEFLDRQLRLDEAGYIWTAPDSSATSVPGVFACGDVADRRWRQAVTAAGSGCIAALEAERLLNKRDTVEVHSSVDEDDGDGGAGAAAFASASAAAAAAAAKQRKGEGAGASAT